MKIAASEMARQRLLSAGAEPLFYGDWLHVLFIHFAIAPEILQPQIPLELDLHDGRAWVSLVAFRMENLRPRFGGALGAMCFRPIAAHEFLNLRTYVRHGNETGIYFIAEIISNWLAVPLGRPIYGLPYHFGQLQYEHDDATGRLRGRAQCGKPPRAFAYHAHDASNRQWQPVMEGSRDAFLLERYSAFTCWRGRRRRFRIWHEPWPQTAVEIRIDDDALLTSRWPWLGNAELIGANYSPGLRGIWMGRPHRLR